MRTLLLSSTFKEDLDSLDPTIREQVIDTLRDIERDPHHSGLRTEKQHTIRGRKIQRSRVNQKYRMLWEWIDGSIGLWHVGNHEYIDGIDSIRAIETVEWTEDVTTRERQPEFDIKAESQEDLPFQNFPSNILRILGVPE